LGEQAGGRVVGTAVANRLQGGMNVVLPAPAFSSRTEASNRH
jgi:hypothetical protein